MLIGEDRRERGALISALAGEDTPAAIAGLRAGDIIQKLDDQPISDMGDLMRKIGSIAAGTKLNIEIRRDGRPMRLQVTIGSKPPTGEE